MTLCRSSSDTLRLHMGAVREEEDAEEEEEEEASGSEWLPRVPSSNPITGLASVK